MALEKESTYRSINLNQKTVLLVKVDDLGYASVEDYQADTPAPEFCRLLRGLANAIEQDFPDVKRLLTDIQNREPACLNHEPVV